MKEISMADPNHRVVLTLILGANEKTHEPQWQARTANALFVPNKNGPQPSFGHTTWECREEFDSYRAPKGNWRITVVKLLREIPAATQSVSEPEPVQTKPVPQPKPIPQPAPETIAMAPLPDGRAFRRQARRSGQQPDALLAIIASDRTGIAPQKNGVVQISARALTRAARQRQQQ